MLNFKNKSNFFFELLNSYDDDYLDVGDGHKIYYEQYGNPHGKPVLFLHGGPGSGCSSFHKRFFDPKVFRVIFLDQRGSGKSIPYGEIENNTTTALISDIEDIRRHLNIDKWLIFGGSWGSTLGILYGINFPKRCLGFILRGIFLGTVDEINWFLYDMKKFFPEAHNKFISYVPQNYRDNILKWFYEQLNLKNKTTSLKAASVWAEYENSCSTLGYVERPISGENALAIAKIESHYFVNNCFINDNFIKENIKKIVNIPAIIIQGRHDVICPPFSAFDIAKIWRMASIEIIDDAGHSAFEEQVARKLINALYMFK
ncbi:MAG: prolyl aminopeptidase [Proteobacteria bacterium]|jgi:proline iminopeptidase|nr:prolyl aminopeptidase [Pseudomonadota bacterium]MDA1135800.1 prolyl aminopeptidase [Pseudomonadota bacterium]